MPTYRATVTKNIGTETWDNVYLVVADDLGLALVQALQAAAAERPLYPPFVFEKQVRVDDMVPNTDNFYTQALNLPGTRSVGGSSEYWPLFNTARVDFTVGPGRPLRKYFRMPLFETDVSAGGLQSDVLALLDSVSDTLVNTLAWVDPQGNSATSYAIYPYVQMRQLRKGSKRPSS